MVVLMDRDYDFRFATNKEMVEIAKKASKDNGMSLSRALDLFVKQIAITGEVNLLDEKELEQQKWARELQKEVQSGIESIEQGEGVTLKEARERFGL